jgi:RHS repeat-associated protein
MAPSGPATIASGTAIAFPLPHLRELDAAERTGTMEFIKTCVIWGEDPVPRRRLGAGAPETPDSSFQGTAASAAVPICSRVTRVGLRRPGLTLPAIALAVALFHPASAQVGPDAGRDGLVVPPGGPQVDPATGMAGVVLPIEVPPGRHGMQPELALRYGSAAGPGNAGYGFTLEAGSIERSTRYGPPRFDNTDTFVMTLQGTTYELFPLDPSSTRFRTVIDTGFLIARLSPGPYGAASTYWVARGRDGRAYRFGWNGDTASGNVSQVQDFKWGLDRVEDTAGNVMEIRLLAQGLRLYPVRVEYASHPATGLPATNIVQICWERRGDETPTPSGERFLYRLSAILTSASGKTARSYSFAYNLAGDPASTVGQCSAPVLPGSLDGGGPAGPVSPGNGRPSRPRLESGSLGRSGLSASATTAVLSIGPSRLVRVSRGDGQGGFLPAIDYTYWPGDGVGSWPSALAGGAPPLPFALGSSGSDEDPGVRLEDLNRDGLPDLIQFAAHQVGSTTYEITKAVYLNSGSSFVYDDAWTASLANLVDAADQSRSAYFVLKRGTLDRVEMGVRFLDVNDDGYPDIVRIAQHYGLGLRKGVFLNTGSGFTADRSALYPLPDEPFVNVHAESSEDLSEDLGVRIADVNGDGRADILVSRADWTGPAYRRVYLYDRGVYRLDARWVLPDDPFVRHVSHGRYLDMGLRLMELNGDGLVDLFRASCVDGMVQNVAYLNTARPGGPAPTWTPGGLNWWLEAVLPERFVDVSSAGDGVSLDRGLRVVGDARLRTSFIVMARSWDGKVSKAAYFPDPGGGWGRYDMPQFPGTFIVKPPDGTPRDQGVRVVDVDGDGALDYLASPQSGTREWRSNTLWMPGNLLSSYSNGIGGRTSLLYRPAPHAGAVEGGGRAGLPYALPVVAERSVSDGMGHLYVTRYLYDGPYHNHAGRDFRGFRSVTVLEPGGEQSTETLFYQQPSLRAAPLRGVPQERITRRVVDAAVFLRSTWSYDTADVVPPLAHPLVREETALFDWTTTDARGGVPVRASAVSYSYAFDDVTHPPDRMMLRRTERREGSVDDPEDDRITSEEFVSALDDSAVFGPSQGRWFLDLPVHRSLSGVDGLVVSESWTYFDDGGLRSVGLRGWATRERQRGGAPGPAGRDPDDRLDPAMTRGFDPYGNIAWEIDSLGRRRTFSRGGVDPTCTFPDSETDPLGRVTTRSFDARTGLLTRLVDPNGAETRIEYDGFGRRTSECGPYDTPDLPTVSYVHDSFASPARVIRFARERSGAGDRAGTAGMTESVAYFDGLGRLLQTRFEAAGGLMIVGGAVTFDAAGRIATEAEPYAAAGEEYAPPPGSTPANRRQYDTASRLTAVTDAAGHTRRREYSGWSASVFDPLEHRRDEHRDAFGEIARVEEFEGGPGSWRAASIATYAHDAAGRLVRLTDPSGASTIVAYDTLGRRVSLDDPHAGSWSYAYDAGGNLVAETDPDARPTTMTYDLLDRLVEKDLPDGSRHVWAYDEGGAAARAIGRLTSIADPSGVQRFEHDLMGRVVRITRRLARHTFTVETGYDAQGRVVSETLPGGPPARFDYDEGGNLVAARPYAPALRYNARGQVIDVEYSGGLRVLHDYDDATGRPTRLRATAPDGHTLLDDAYGYLADGQIERLDDLHDPQRPSSQAFTYDGRHRLTRAAGPYGDLSYVYDDAGNLTSKEGITLSYDDPAHPQRVTRTSAGLSMSYDSSGNLTETRSPSFHGLMDYDPSGRMTRLSDDVGGLVVESAYDAGGQRVREVTDMPGKLRSVLLTPMPQIEVRDGVVTLHYFAGGLRIAMLQGGDRLLFPITDHLGSTRVVVDASGGVTSRYDYRPYGQPTAATDDATIGRTFAGALTNRASDLLLLGSRQYDPALGRFLQPDAVVADPLAPLALNRYAYAGDNPVNLTDPNGRNPIAFFLIAGAIALLDHDTRQDVLTSIALTAITIYLTGIVGPGAEPGAQSLLASKPALYAAGVTPVIMRTPLGEAIVEGYTALFQDLGLGPRPSTVAASVFTSFLLNASFQRGFAGALAGNGEINAGLPLGDQPALQQDALSHGGPSFGSATGDIYGMPIQGLERHGVLIEPESIHQLVDAAGNVVGAYGTRDLGLGFEHGTAAFYGRPASFTRPHHLYLLGGISTQQFARELFRAGYSGTLFTLSGRASDFLIEFIYGSYGGGLALGVQAGREAAAGDHPDP